jgi:hypothetical protein
MPADRPKLDLGEMVRGTLRTCRAQWRLLLVAGLILFVPLGLLEALDARLQGQNVDELSDLAAAGVLAVGFAHAATALLGEVFYSGVVAAGVMEARGGRRPRLGRIARTVPYGRLVVVDLLFALIVLIGLTLLVVPGFVFFIWLALAGPAVEIEGRRPIDALGRSRELVRGSFWRVLAIVVPLELVTDAVFNAAGEGGTRVLGDSLVADWTGSAIGGLLATAPYAAATVVLTYELIALERQPYAQGRRAMQSAPSR